MDDWKRQKKKEKRKKKIPASEPFPLGYFERKCSMIWEKKTERVLDYPCKHLDENDD